MIVAFSNSSGLVWTGPDCVVTINFFSSIPCLGQKYFSILSKPSPLQLSGHFFLKTFKAKGQNILYETAEVRSRKTKFRSKEGLSLEKSAVQIRQKGELITF